MQELRKTRIYKKRNRERQRNQEFRESRVPERKQIQKKNQELREKAESQKAKQKTQSFQIPNTKKTI